MLFVLGLGDRVVGVGDYARWPPEVAGIPKLGGLFDSRLESIAGLDPDLAVLLPSEERLRVQLEKMGVEVLTVRSDSIADVEEMAVSIGRRCGVEEAATTFLESWKSELAPRAPSQSTRVLLSVTREPGRMADVLVSGPDTFLHELIDRLGAVNVMADAQLSYPEVGLEEVIVRQPQVVIELQASPGNYDDLRFDWARVASEVPMGEMCVRIIAGDHVLIPGPRLPRLYRELEEALQDCVEQVG
jgi:iron complex transport system substrate-binding protein